MNAAPLKIGNTVLKNNVLLAPLAGYTNYPFRRLCARYGAGLTFTEMVSAKGLEYGSENTAALLYTTDEESPKAAQIFGRDARAMRLACEHPALAPFPIVDINMGCPVPKIYKNGEGSALLNEPESAEQIVKECVKSGKTITVKFRIGVTKDKLVTRDFARRMEDAGASMITVHGRTRDAFYAGEVNWKEIASAKSAVKIPVVANGGIFGREDGERLLSETGADGIMIARAALFNPQIFCEFTGATGENKSEMIRRQLRETKEILGEKFATVYMRKMVGFYLKGTRGAAEIKARLFACPSTNEVLKIVDELEW